MASRALTGGRNSFTEQLTTKIDIMRQRAVLLLYIMVFCISTKIYSCIDDVVTSQGEEVSLTGTNHTSGSSTSAKNSSLGSSTSGSTTSTHDSVSSRYHTYILDSLVLSYSIPIYRACY